MSLLVVGLVVLAALLHASWHALVKASPDKMIGLAAINVISGIVGAALVPFAAWPDAKLWLILALSVAVHLVYKIGLAKLYGIEDLNKAYPIARGMTPLLVTLFAVVTVDETLSPMELGGVTLISAAVLWLAFERGFPWGHAAKPLMIAAATGLAVAVYTVVDGIGARTAETWFSYAAWLYLLDASAFVGLARLLTGPGMWHAIAVRGWASIASGVVAIGSYGVFLWALDLGAFGAVAALRETSLVFAAVIGVLFLGEPRNLARMAAPVVILAGIVLIAAAAQTI